MADDKAARTLRKLKVPARAECLPVIADFTDCPEAITDCAPRSSLISHWSSLIALPAGHH
jgi:hypothetical protein